jgi:hypothetical protein
VAHFVRYSIKNIEPKTSAKPFIARLKEQLDEIAKAKFNHDFPPIQPTDTIQNPSQASPKKCGEDCAELLVKFLGRKENEGITRKSVNLLNTRIKNFIEFVGNSPCDMTTKNAMNYLEGLMKCELTAA